MGFQTKSSPGLTLLEQATTPESDSESIFSTIPTQIQPKPSKIDLIGPFTNNTGFHLVTSSNTQPKILIDTTAPPYPPRYPHSQYDYRAKVPKTRKKLIQTVLNFPLKKFTKK